MNDDDKFFFYKGKQPLFFFDCKGKQPNRKNKVEFGGGRGRVWN